MGGSLTPKVTHADVQYGKAENVDGLFLLSSGFRKFCRKVQYSCYSFLLIHNSFLVTIVQELMTEKLETYIILNIIRENYTFFFKRLKMYLFYH